jgi:hypothetical protein
VRDAAEDHRQVAGEFTKTVEGTAAAAWDAPAPPEGWVARDVVRHLVEWLPAFLGGSTGIVLPAGPSVDDDPAAPAGSSSTDVFLHRWDLARATGQDETLDPQRCAELLDGMLPMDEVLRQSGQYGPRVEVPEDADAQAKLLAFIGRTP